MARFIKNSAISAAGLAVGERNARLMGNKDNYVASDDTGTTVAGPVSFAASTEQIRLNGLFVMNSALQMTIPSTLAFPSPVLRVDMPVKQMKTLMEQVALMAGLLGMLPS